MITFWIIIGLIIISIISKIAKNARETQDEYHRRERVQRRQERTSLRQERAEARHIDQTFQVEDAKNDSGTRTLHDIESDREPDLSIPWTEQEATFGGMENDRVPGAENDTVPYERKNLTPYKREHITPYRRESETPYQRKNKTPYQSDNHHLSAFSRFRKKQWAEGIVLAEVLQEPRAKRPHPSAGKYGTSSRG